MEQTTRKCIVDANTTESFSGDWIGSWTGRGDGEQFTIRSRDVVPWWLVVVLLAREAMLLVMLVVLARHGYGPLQVHLAGKAGTFALLYAFPLLLLAHWGGIVGDLASVLGWACAWWGVALYWFAGLLYVRQAWALVGRRGGADAGEPRTVAV